MQTLFGPAYIGCMFENQHLEIDQCKFENSAFENCVLTYGGGHLEFENNHLDKVSWKFVDAAARTLDLLDAICSMYEGVKSKEEVLEMLLSTVDRKVDESKPIENNSIGEN